MPGYQPGVAGDQTGLIALLCLVAAFALWAFYCWYSGRPRWVKIEDIKAGTTRYHHLPPPDPSLISFPPSHGL